jgi:hypothetical protein
MVDSSGTALRTNALPEESTIDLHYQVPAQQHHAYEFFASVNRRLGKNIYHLYCQAFLA